MKKILLIVLMIAGLANAQPAQSNLMGLGMSGQLAGQLGRENTTAWRYLFDTTGLANNTFLVGRNAANSANIGMIKVGSDNSTALNAITGNSIGFRINDVTQGFINNPGAPRLTMTDGTRSIIMQASTTPAIGTISSHNLDVIANGGTVWGFTTTGQLANNGTNGGDIVFARSGTGLQLQEATPGSACMGVSTPNGTTNVAVATTCAVSGARVFYTRVGAVTNMASISTTVAPSGTGFSFASTNAADTLASSVVWMIVKEAA